MGNTAHKNLWHEVKSALRRVFLLINSIMKKQSWHNSYPSDIQKQQTAWMISE